MAKAIDELGAGALFHVKRLFLDEPPQKTGCLIRQPAPYKAGRMLSTSTCTAKRAPSTSASLRRLSSR